eukprot:TRINITY_DN36609_c0_g1_i2.p1 TRINITY_DN36609_c0_g1~~TRINITY_DN36609_c0_g1_i2.p1  ORF type:complete len:849 (-),score=125.38 TRINITY_DN36609_c0_g1_i2:158-2704(-)
MTCVPGSKRRRRGVLPSELDAVIGRLLSSSDDDRRLAFGYMSRLCDCEEFVEQLSAHASKGDVLDVCFKPIHARCHDSPAAAAKPEADAELNDAVCIIIKCVQVPGMTALVFAKLKLIVKKFDQLHQLLDADDVTALALCLVASIGKGLGDINREACGFLESYLQACKLAPSESRADFLVEALPKVPDFSGFCTKLLNAWPSDTLDLSKRDSVLEYFTCRTDFWASQTAAREEFVSGWLKSLIQRMVAGSHTTVDIGDFLIESKGASEIIAKDISTGSVFDDLVLGLAFLFRQPPTKPEDAMRLCAYPLWRMLRHEVMKKAVFAHRLFKDLVAGTIDMLSSGTAEDPEHLQNLATMMKCPKASGLVLAGGNVRRIVVALAKLFSEGDFFLTAVCVELLVQFVQTAGSTALLVEDDLLKPCVSEMSRCEEGKALLTSLMPDLQWRPGLIPSVPLEFKRDWVSEQIFQSAPNQTKVQLLVHRDQILEDACSGLNASIAVLRMGLDVSFGGADDAGAGDGHRREFFRLAAAELMNPDCGLFKSTDGGRSFHISATAGNSQPDHLAQFELCGKLLGLALLHRETLPAMQLTTALRKQLLGDFTTSLDDLASIDPELFEKKVHYIKMEKYKAGDAPMQLADMGLVFEDEPQPDVFPELKTELCSGGSAMAVTEENKMYYLQLLCEHRCFGSVRPQVEAMVRGFNAIVPEAVQQRIQRIVSPAEFSLLICGCMDIDVAAWKAASKMADGTTAETWERFWRLVETMSKEQRSQLLEFVTGSSTVPVGGFAALSGYGGPGNIHAFTVAPPRRPGLPTAATCFNTIYLREYESLEAMRAALLEAIGHRGFSEAAVAA